MPAWPPGLVPAAATPCGTAEMRCRDRSTDAGERSRSPQAQERAPPSGNAAADIAGAPSCSRACPVRTGDGRPDHGSPAWRPSSGSPKLGHMRCGPYGPTRRLGGGGTLFDARPGGMALPHAIRAGYVTTCPGLAHSSAGRSVRRALAIGHPLRPTPPAHVATACRYRRRAAPAGLAGAARILVTRTRSEFLPFVVARQRQLGHRPGHGGGSGPRSGLGGPAPA